MDSNLREKIYIRDKGKCRYCRKQIEWEAVTKQGRKDVTLDHIIPKCLGGTDSEDNLTIACFRCNNLKGSRITIKPRP